MRTPHIATSIWTMVRHNPFHFLLILVSLLLAWIALVGAFRSDLLWPSKALNPDQVELFLVLIGGGFGTAATALTTLFTRQHNKREQYRLRVESVIKSLESLPADTPKPKVAGVLASMVLLGHQRVAIRVLGPAWDEDKVDDGTATWLIGQVLTGTDTHDHTDDIAINEATALLAIRAARLTDAADTGRYHFPGHFMRHWSTPDGLPNQAKDNLLLAMGRMLVSRTKEWWCPEGDPPEWPTAILLECAIKDPDPAIRSSAAVLLSALHDCFPKQFEENVSADRLTTILEQSAAATTQSVPAEYFTLAERIRTGWGNGLSS